MDARLTRYYRDTYRHTFTYEQDFHVSGHGMHRVAITINSYDHQSWVEVSAWTGNGWQNLWRTPAKDQMSLQKTVTRSNGTEETQLLYWGADLATLVTACSEVVDGEYDQLTEWIGK